MTLLGLVMLLAVGLSIAVNELDYRRREWKERAVKAEEAVTFWRAHTAEVAFDRDVAEALVERIRGEIESYHGNPVPAQCDEDGEFDEETWIVSEDDSEDCETEDECEAEVASVD